MPFFVVFEGLDGVGKSTLSTFILNFLNSPTRTPLHQRTLALFNISLHNNALLTREPYGSDHLVTVDDYIENRKKHIWEVIDPFVRPTEHCASSTSVDFLLCDRYVLSTAAYQSTNYADALRIIDLQRTFPVPDITILLTASIDTLEHRLSTRENDGITKKGFDSASRAFKERVQDTYIHLAQDYPNVHIFNAEQPIESLAESVITLLLSLSEKRDS